VDLIKNGLNKAERTRISFQECFECKEPFIKANRNNIMRVVTNLIRNSVEAIDEKGTIRISTHSLNETIVLSISDTGRGLSSNDAKQVFNLDFTKGKKAGTGLGLAIAKELVAEEKGTIEFYSEGPGLGACVTLSFPRHA
jgi:signal transduction histidine kinase